MFSPYYFTAVIHAGNRYLTSNLHHDGSFIIADHNAMGSLHVSNSPNSFKAIIKCILEPISSRVPYANCSILRTSYYYGKFWVETDGRNIVCVPLQCLNTAFCLVIPDLCRVIIRTSYQVWLVTTSEVINTVNPFQMGIQRKIWIW
uniref:Uncharacterized protein n=1 Tax=Opuntia streptacantha TaxID=393608 RepID=A0A7C8ZC66_OPUST